MTFAEMILVAAAFGFFYFLLKPLRRRLEASIYRQFSKRSQAKEKPVIDITDFIKKDKKKE